MLRATNTGISGAIDAKGVTINRLPSQRSAVLDVNVQGQRGLTPYARFGNQPLLFLMLLGLILVWYTTRARSRA